MNAVAIAAQLRTVATTDQAREILNSLKGAQVREVAEAYSEHLNLPRSAGKRKMIDELCFAIQMRMSYRAISGN